MKPRVYLAGGISGLSYDDATDWREYAAGLLAPEVHALSPMRNKQFLSHLERISGTGEEYAAMGPLATAAGILARDHLDCSRSDALLVNLLDATEKSVGTIIELGIAYTRQIPIIACMERGNVHEHVMVSEIVRPFRVDNLNDGIALVKAVLGV